MIYIISIFSINSILIFNNILLNIICLLLFNITIYTLLAKYNPNNNSDFRIILNYIIVSSFTFILISIYIVLLFTPNNYFLYYFLLLTGIIIKLPLYPFTNWGLSIYDNIPFYLFIFITLLTKTIYTSIIIYINDFNTLFYIILISNIICIPIIGYISNNFIQLLVYSGALQIAYLLLPLLSIHFLITIAFLIYYILTLLILFNFLNYSYHNTLLYYFNLFIIYSYVGLPPFIGFYLKYITLEIFTNYFKLITLFMIFTLISTFMYINLFNLLNSKFKLYFNTYSLSKKICLLILIFIFVSLLPYDWLFNNI